MAIPEEDRKFDGVGTSAFHVTQLTSYHVERPEMNIKKDLKTEGHPLLSAVDWVWREWAIDGGKGFLESIIQPFSGNYRSIEANGAAWRKVGTLFGQLTGNVGMNLTKLATQHWAGPAAGAMQAFVKTYWTNGATVVAGRVCEFIGAGFDKIGELSRAIAKAAANQVRSIFEIVTNIVSKRFFPGIGWARTFLEYLADLFGDVQTLHKDIQALVSAFKELKRLEGLVKELVAAAQSYVDTFHQVIDAVTRIPEVGTLADAQSTYNDINRGAASMETKRAEVEDKGKQVLTNIDNLGKSVGPRIGG